MPSLAVRSRCGAVPRCSRAESTSSPGSNGHWRRCGTGPRPSWEMRAPDRLGSVQPFERLRAIARHGGDDRLLVGEAADCLGEFDDDPAALVVTCRRLLHHHPERAPLWWLCARVLAGPEPSEAAWDAEALVRDDHTADRLSGLLPFPADHPVAVLGWPAATGEALALRPDLEVLVIRDDRQRGGDERWRARLAQ